MPKISVIIPVYNVEKYLPECLESILNQTFHDFVISLHELSIITYGELCSKFDVLPDDKYVNDAVKFLINKKIINIIK